jgi:P27 family predicted phage terminase small subunit
MAKGRRALPSNLHVLHGTHREDRHGGGLSVQIVNPDPPEGMPVGAITEWKKIAPVLSKYNLLSDLDLTALEIYCRVYARWMDAERRLEESGELVFETQTGYQTQSAYLNIINQCLKQMDTSLAHFGMTPATRERLKAIANQPKQQDLFSDFLTRKRDTAQNG